MYLSKLADIKEDENMCGSASSFEFVKTLLLRMVSLKFNFSFKKFSERQINFAHIENKLAQVLHDT